MLIRERGKGTYAKYGAALFSCSKYPSISLDLYALSAYIEVMSLIDSTNGLTADKSTAFANVVILFNISPDSLSTAI